MAEFLAHFGVDRAERFVEQQQARFECERARQRDALALSAGELVRIAVSSQSKPIEREQLFHPLAALGLVLRDRRGCTRRPKPMF